MANFRDLTGYRAGRLTVISRSHSKNGVYWHCVCDCGTHRILRGGVITSGSTMSCGCGQRENLARLVDNIKNGRHPGLKHGLARSRLDSTMDNMIKRCESPKDKRWDRYGGRGIKICPQWRRNRSEFYEWAMDNGYADDLSIERIDLDGDYEPSNCRWITMAKQQLNTSRNRILEWAGERMTVVEWARRLGVRGQALQHRVDRGWSLERIFTQPYRTRKKPQMSIFLRSYQSKMVDEIRDSLRTHRSVLGVAPCGAGKTVIFSYIASKARERGKKIGIFAHRAELLDQISKTLRMFKVPHGIISAGSVVDRRQSVFVCSAQTYARRGVQTPEFDLVIIDEAHHCTNGSTWGKCIERSPNAKIIGVSASPARLDGRGLGETFETMVLGPTVRELIELKALSRYALFAPGNVDLSAVHSLGGDYRKDELAGAVDKPAITGDAVKHYRKHLDGRPSVAFCVSVAHAQHVAETFRSQGYTAQSVDGKMSREHRGKIISDFSAGKINVLTSADLVNEGLDCPGIHGVILLRPTKSLSLYIQQVGRAVRLCDGKDRAIILDHVGNWERHGLPDDDRDWSLEARAKAKVKAPPEQTRECPRCFCRFRITQFQCPECGAAIERRVRELDEREGDLKEVDVEAVRAARPKSEAMKSQAKARTADALLELFTMQKKAKCAEAGIPFDDAARAAVVRRVDHVMSARRNGYGQGQRRRAG